MTSDGPYNNPERRPRITRQRALNCTADTPQPQPTLRSTSATRTSSPQAQTYYHSAGSPSPARVVDYGPTNACRCLVQRKLRSPSSGMACSRSPLAAGKRLCREERAFEGWLSSGFLSTLLVYVLDVEEKTLDILLHRAASSRFC